MQWHQDTAAAARGLVFHLTFLVFGRHSILAVSSSSQVLTPITLTFIAQFFGR
jgi:hypothetical protein